jgi:uncharacterized protein YkwD
MLAAVAVGATAAPARPSAHNETQLSSLNRQVAAAINAFRRAHGLAQLRISSSLNGSSRQHSNEMGADGYFAHRSYNGRAFWERIQAYYSAANYSYWTVGENLLWKSPDVSAATALNMWIASPEHLRNLLDPHWTDLGVSSVHVDSAGGVYGGKPVTIITTDFGARR